MAADNDQMGSLHETLSRHFADILANGEEVRIVDKETGEVTIKRVKPSPAIYAQIRQFLKDNNILSIPVRGRPLADLSKAFEDFDPPEQHPH